MSLSITRNRYALIIALFVLVIFSSISAFLINNTKVIRIVPSIQIKGSLGKLSNNFTLADIKKLKGRQQPDVIAELISFGVDNITYTKDAIGESIVVDQSSGRYVFLFKNGRLEDVFAVTKAN